MSLIHYYENMGDLKLAIGQPALTFKGVAYKGMGKLLRLSTARKLKEIRESMNGRR